VPDCQRNGHHPCRFPPNRFQIANFITCEGPSDIDSCPTGTIEHDNLAKQRTVTELFDGSNIASVQIVKPKGETTRQVTLNCGPTSQVGQ